MAAVGEQAAKRTGGMDMLGQERQLGGWLSLAPAMAGVAAKLDDHLAVRLADRTEVPAFYEFFAGGGMARAGLGPGWACLFANDFDARKGLVYQANWGAGGELHVGDIRDLEAEALPGLADLAWGSFPCQDLSLAGAGAGLGGERSGTFYPFWRLISELAEAGRAPAMVAVENVCGALTSRQGRDFEAICRTFMQAGYRFGPMVINADLFVPQSRPRLFVIGVRLGIPVDPLLLSAEPCSPFHTNSLRRAVSALPDDLRGGVLWWRLPQPPQRGCTLADVLDAEPQGVSWRPDGQTQALLALMSPLNRAKVQAAQAAGRRVVGSVYRRTRRDPGGDRLQRAEVRFDDVAGCLRTPAGGSSRLTVLVVDGQSVRSRLISARESARLMGLDDAYLLPPSYSDACHLTGDGVAVPVVRHLARHILEPLLAGAGETRREAA